MERAMGMNKNNNEKEKSQKEPSNESQKNKTGKLDGVSVNQPLINIIRTCPPPNP